MNSLHQNISHNTIQTAAKKPGKNAKVLTDNRDISPVQRNRNTEIGMMDSIPNLEKSLESQETPLGVIKNQKETIQRGKKSDKDRKKRILARLKRIHDRANRRIKKNPKTLGKKRLVNTPYGPVGVSKGRGGQPYVTTRVGDYDGNKIKGGRYNHLKIPETLMRTLSNKNIKPQTKNRKAAMLHGILNEAEDYRFPGAGKLGRSAAKRVGNKTRSYEQTFEGNKPDFPMAAKKGAKSYNRILDGEQELSEGQMKLIEDASDSSSDESESSSEEESEDTSISLDDLSSNESNDDSDDSDYDNGIMV